MVEFRTLKGVGTDKILSAFNHSFSDYLVPLQLTQEQFDKKSYNENANWDYSVGAFDGDQLVGIIIHCEKEVNGKKYVYNGGTGVIPTHRGNAITKRMYDFILPILKEEMVDTLFLEVLEPNQPAIKSYLNSGFQTIRRLTCKKGVQPEKTIENSEFELKEIPQADWDLFRSFWDYLPTWQNSEMVVDRIQEKTILGAFKDEELVGYIIYQPAVNRIHQFAVKPAYRQKGIASLLFQNLKGNGSNEFSILNVDGNSSATEALFDSMGWETTVHQLEMSRKL